MGQKGDWRPRPDPRDVDERLFESFLETMDMTMADGKGKDGAGLQLKGKGARPTSDGQFFQNVDRLVAPNTGLLNGFKGKSKQKGYRPSAPKGEFDDSIFGGGGGGSLGSNAGCINRPTGKGAPFLQQNDNFGNAPISNDRLRSLFDDQKGGKCQGFTDILGHPFDKGGCGKGKSSNSDGGQFIDDFSPEKGKGSKTGFVKGTMDFHGDSPPDRGKSSKAGFGKGKDFDVFFDDVPGCSGNGMQQVKGSKTGFFKDKTSRIIGI